MMDRWSNLILQFLHSVYIYIYQLYTLNYRIFSDTTINLEKVKDISIRKMEMERNGSCFQSREICVIYTKALGVKRWRTVLWIHKVCSLMCICNRTNNFDFQAIFNTLFLWALTTPTMWNTYGLWNSEVKASFYFFFSPSTRTIICIESAMWILQDNQQWILLLFIPERLINEGNGGVRATEQLDSLLSLPKHLGYGVIERDLLEE